MGVPFIVFSYGFHTFTLNPASQPLHPGHTMRHLPERLFCRIAVETVVAIIKLWLGTHWAAAVKLQSMEEVPQKDTRHCHYNRRHRVRQNCRTVRWWHTELHACEHPVRKFAANRSVGRVAWSVDNCVRSGKTAAAVCFHCIFWSGTGKITVPAECRIVCLWRYTLKRTSKLLLILSRMQCEDRWGQCCQCLGKSDHSVGTLVRQWLPIYGGFQLCTHALTATCWRLSTDS